MPNTGGWQAAHLAVWNFQTSSGLDSFGSIIARQVLYWGHYADEHFKRYGSLIGDDCVLGEAWRDIGRGLRALLNGESGRLDCGTVDAILLAVAAENGAPFEP